MIELKLSKLPDRTPVKFTITVSPDLAETLRGYAAEYERHYGTVEPIAALIPYMLAAFIESDSGFKKAKRDRQTSAEQNAAQKSSDRRRQPTEVADAAKIPTS